MRGLCRSLAVGADRFDCQLAMINHQGNVEELR